MGILSSLFGKKSKKIYDFLSRGAVIVDVRSKAEYDEGAIPGSVHIPLQNIKGELAKIKKWDKPVICVCARGGRSGSATLMLKGKGVEVINGGGWLSLSKKMKGYDH